jgi:hypothetical protein
MREVVFFSILQGISMLRSKYKNYEPWKNLSKFFSRFLDEFERFIKKWFLIKFCFLSFRCAVCCPFQFCGSSWRKGANHLKFWRSEKGMGLKSILLVGRPERQDSVDYVGGGGVLMDSIIQYLISCKIKI